MAASEKILSALHDALATELKEQITEGRTILDSDGEPIKISPGASVLNVARQWLKDEGIRCQPNRPSAPMKDLVEALETDDPYHDPEMPKFPQ